MLGVMKITNLHLKIERVELQQIVVLKWYNRNCTKAQLILLNHCVAGIMFHSNFWIKTVARAGEMQYSKIYNTNGNN